ncbi:MAG: phosphate ABC transporter permease PstA [Nitrospinae bacterium]|nr:phosphate ABC transporter permease PstA [Nitrospinota bacterium]
MTIDTKIKDRLLREGLPKRYAKEKRFKLMGKLSVYSAIGMLLVLFCTIVGNGYSAFQQTHLKLKIVLSADVIDPTNTHKKEDILRANYQGLVKQSLKEMFPEVRKRSEKKMLYQLISPGAAYQLQEMVMKNKNLIGQTVDIWVPANDDVDMFMKEIIDAKTPEAERRIKDNQILWIKSLEQVERIKLKFNTAFFTNGDSRDPELAGIMGSLMGSFYTMLVTLGLSFPLGVATAIYLEEFAPKNRWTDIVEVNINNLAAVPSIVFGLLGLGIFLNVAGLPRSAPIVGGMVLTLMTLPTIIISSRAALKSVPPSIRDAALGVGASKMQMVLHHVLPLAMPGMLTGSIIGMAQALGETAPLLMIGMVAFIVDVPGGFFDPSTVLPVQIYLWADSPERAFIERTSAAIIVLLGFLICMNAIAVLLRKKFETRW